MKLIHDVNSTVDVKVMSLPHVCIWDKILQFKGTKSYNMKLYVMLFGFLLTIRVLGSFNCGKDKLE